MKKFILLLYLIFFTSNLNAETSGTHEFGVKLLGFYEYDEPRFMHLRAGMSETDKEQNYGLTYTFGKSFLVNDYLTEFEFDNSYKKYNQSYWSNSSGNLYGTEVEIYDSRLLYGIQLSDTMKFKSGIGYRYLYHYWQDMNTSTGNWGYDREQEYTYIPIIAEFKMPISEINLDGTLKVEFDQIFNGNLTSYKGYKGGTNTDVGNQNDDGYIWNISYEFTNNNNVIFEPYYTFMSVEESNVANTPAGTWQEPSNYTKEFGLNIKKTFGDRGLSSEDNHKRILENDQYYFGIEALYSKIDSGFYAPTVNTDIDETDIGYSISTGMKILEEEQFGLNLEVAFNQFGKAITRCDTNDTFKTDGRFARGLYSRGTTLTCTADDVDWTIESHSTSIGIVPYYTVGNFYINANVGLNRWDQNEVESVGGSSNAAYDYSGVDFYYGFGVGATKDNFTFELAQLKHEMHYDTESLIASIKYKIGEKPKIDLKTNTEKSINDWSGFYFGVYQSEDELSAYAESPTYPSDPYAVNTDMNKNNLGIFFGYNYEINNIIFGIETTRQDNIGKDQGLSTLNGSVTYDNMEEYKLKIGYSFDRYLVESFYGFGDLDLFWSEYDYASDPSTIYNYETKGIGLSTKITNNTFVGLSLSETNFDINYSDYNYTEGVQLKAARLKLGYLF